jgi:hypothetical protein
VDNGRRIKSYFGENKDVNQTYDMAPIKLTIESVKLLQHTNVDTETAEYIKSIHDKDINGELNVIQFI